MLPSQPSRNLILKKLHKILTALEIKHLETLHLNNYVMNSYMWVHEQDVRTFLEQLLEQPFLDPLDFSSYSN